MKSSSIPFFINFFKSMNCVFIIFFSYRIFCLTRKPWISPFSEKTNILSNAVYFHFCVVFFYNKFQFNSFFEITNTQKKKKIAIENRILWKFIMSGQVEIDVPAVVPVIQMVVIPRMKNEVVRSAANGIMVGLITMCSVFLEYNLNEPCLLSVIGSVLFNVAVYGIAARYVISCLFCSRGNVMQILAPTLAPQSHIIMAMHFLLSCLFRFHDRSSP